jgi:hypothetical protein
LEEIDIHVSRAPPEHKRVLVKIYTKTGHWTEHATRLECSSKDSYFRAKKSAEVYLNTSLSVRMT